jgi:hypothetical protein
MQAPWIPASAGMTFFWIFVLLVILAHAGIQEKSSAGLYPFTAAVSRMYLLIISISFFAAQQTRKSLI